MAGTTRHSKSSTSFYIIFTHFFRRAMRPQVYKVFALCALLACASVALLSRTPSQQAITTSVQLVSRELSQFDVRSFLKVSDTMDQWLRNTSTKTLVAPWTDAASPGVADLELVPETLRDACEKERTRRRTRALAKATVIISLYNVTKVTDAVAYLSRSFRRLPDDVVDDVIVTLDYNIQDSAKESVENNVDWCSVCRVFYFEGSLYHARNRAAIFARNQVLVYLDARVELGEGCLQSLLLHLDSNPMSIVSPQMRLRSEKSCTLSVGAHRVELTWDLTSVRGPVHAEDIRRTINSTSIAVAQTSLQREIFALRKDLFQRLGGFELSPVTSGGEHVSFSLKALGCGANVTTALCATAYLDLENVKDMSTWSSGVHNYKSTPTYAQADFPSLSFLIHPQEVADYFSSASKTWLDDFSQRYFSCSKRMDATPLRSRVKPAYVRLMRTSDPFKTLRFALVAKKCHSSNFRSVVAERQPRMNSPPRSCMFYGYIRTMDGMYAVGMAQNDAPLARIPSMSTDSSKLFLTRNSSLWAGPFALVGRQLKYGSSLCVKATPYQELRLATCDYSTVDQQFSYHGYQLTLAKEHKKQLCAPASTNVTVPLAVRNCVDGDDVSFFRFDVEFKPSCT